MNTEDHTIAPPAPRPVNARASSRSWHEGSVRTWMALSLFMLLATGYLAATRLSATITERRILAGEKITATIRSIQGSTTAGRDYDRFDGFTAELDYTAGGKKYERIQGLVSPGVEGKLSVGSTLEIRVSPNDPTFWIDRVVPRSLVSEFALVLALLPALFLLLFCMWWSRHRVMAIWRDGIESTAIAVDAKQSTIAPGSRILRYAIADGSDKRVFSVLCPAAHTPAAGEAFSVIHPPGKPGQAIVAELYL